MPKETVIFRSLSESEWNIYLECFEFEIPMKYFFPEPKLTTETLQILDLVKDKRCFLLSGGAGSGKTYVSVRATPSSQPSKIMTWWSPKNQQEEIINEKKQSH